MSRPAPLFDDDELAALAAITSTDLLLARHLWLQSPPKGGSNPADADVSKAVAQMNKRQAERAARLTDLARTGKLVMLAWLLDMMSVVKQTHVAAAKAADPAVSVADDSPLDKRIASEFRFLHDFAGDLGGRTKRAMIPDPLTRARMYAYAAWGTFWSSKRAMRRRQGAIEERNILSPAEHCPECPALTARGWVPIGTLPIVGTRTCRNNCKCSMEFR